MFNVTYWTYVGIGLLGATTVVFLIKEWMEKLDDWRFINSLCGNDKDMQDFGFEKQSLLKKFGPLVLLTTFVFGAVGTIFLGHSPEASLVNVNMTGEVEKPTKTLSSEEIEVRRKSADVVAQDEDATKFEKRLEDGQDSMFRLREKLLNRDKDN